jgi:hypothetical protein
MTTPFQHVDVKSIPAKLQGPAGVYVEYFNHKWKEIVAHTALPFDLDDKEQIDFEAHEDKFHVPSGHYFSANLKDGRRIIMLGTVLGTLAMYEMNTRVEVPKDVNEAGEVWIPSYNLHAPHIFWEAGLLTLSQHGRPNLTTFVEIFGYYPMEGMSGDINRNNMAQRLEKIYKKIVKRARYIDVKPD